MNRFALATAIVLASVAGASAGDYRFGSSSTPDIDARQAQEARRIEDGRRSGQLSGREYRALQDQQARIAQHERIAKADGYVSPGERAQLNRELDQASSDIRHLKHNNETAGGHRRWYSRWW